ncbi:2-C-methyl-D-erythritol 4-phosphate cytidylyltransferase [Silvimonas iriomotensis]|uniref:2-C-methyl-D-erythritol 4-phosphate cytidylyltransferase n=1 Tax=Silvimonas iriomotensis TaxID=449662 RepID=A0ABQ2PAL2_9NEIS|nr:2-C-methyl-D-erythritol 4-phosphate cytidylyltransferase [Silvimonas iriomotensis]GGP21683.1 2-C-methyl-D-erythritol 4-phosphate cytidylyltransferase [Silvimonas iriomotensis]
MSIIALLPAAGSGSRMGAAIPKQYLPLCGKTVIEHTVAALHAVDEIDHVVVVISPDDTRWDELSWQGFARLKVLRCGGDSRAASVCNGLAALRDDGLEAQSWVLVHDAARPCISPALVAGMIAELKDDPVGGILAVPVADTLKAADAGQRIAATRPRDGLWQAQTPQMFRLQPLHDALVSGMGPDITDEASAIEKTGQSPKLVHGSPWNLKVTWPQDLHLASLILAGAQATTNKD